MQSFCAKFFLIFLFFSTQLFALSPEKRLSDEKQEERARSLFMQVRCVVCGGQVIENSDSNFSFELRQLIREKILVGKNDAQIKQELVAEFGQDILTNPTVTSKSGFPLFFLTAIFIAISAVLFAKIFTKKS